MFYLTMGKHFEKGIVRRFPHGVNITECSYTNLDGLAYRTPRLNDVAYCS